MNTRGYIDEIKTSFNASYYKVRQILGISESTMSRYVKGGGEASEEIALKIAEKLKIDPAIVIANIDIEHAKTEEVKAVRRRIKEILQRSSAAVLVLSTTVGAVINEAVCVLC